MSEDWQNYDTGPFCCHWSHPADCEKVCACGDTCSAHREGECNEPDCACLAWTEVDEVDEEDS